MLQRAFDAMGPRDPNFVEQFQTTGFDQRVNELYMFEAFRSAGLNPTFEHEAPDFMLDGHGSRWAVEATTANPSEGGAPQPLPEDEDELRDFLENEVPIRFGSALLSKLKREYWNLPHLEGMPLVLAVQSFALDDLHQVNDTSLISYLYGLRTSGSIGADGTLEVEAREIHEHVGSKEIPSGFFKLPGAENVAAILWTNSGTVGKFLRMGFQEGVNPDGLVAMLRTGNRLDPDPNAAVPARFTYEVGTRWEHWYEGLVLAHNPDAVNPLPDDAFPQIIQHRLRDDGLIGHTMPAFHAYSSLTVPVVVKE